jgi:hypothetical protein
VSGSIDAPNVNRTYYTFGDARRRTRAGGVSAPRPALDFTWGRPVGRVARDEHDGHAAVAATLQSLLAQRKINHLHPILERHRATLFPARAKSDGSRCSRASASVRAWSARCTGATGERIASRSASSAPRMAATIRYRPAGATAFWAVRYRYGDL